MTLINDSLNTIFRNMQMKASLPTILNALLLIGIVKQETLQ